MTFYEAFSENMEQLGVPAPRRLFDSLTTATATIVALNKAVATYGPRVTMRELVLTMPALVTPAAALEFGTLTAGITAAFYVGACVGSLLVATGHTITHLGLLRQASQLRLTGNWLHPAFAQVTVRARGMPA